VPARKSSFVGWLLVLALILGAAGAWFYWDRQQASAKESGTTSPR
jgi:uncharacterized protein HemX